MSSVLTHLDSELLINHDKYVLLDEHDDVCKQCLSVWVSVMSVVRSVRFQ